MNAKINVGIDTINPMNPKHIPKSPGEIRASRVFMCGDPNPKMMQEQAEYCPG